MDPMMALLSAAEYAIEGDYDSARVLVAHYREWRIGGGFEPGPFRLFTRDRDRMRGDAQATRLILLCR